MMLEQTLAILKPDATRKNIIGKVITLLEDGKLKVVDAKMLQLTQEQAEEFYAIHKERNFFGDLIRYITSGPVLVMILEGENAVERNRKIMGATDPQQADPGTIRREFASTIEENVIHGSDSKENALREINFFFPKKNATVTSQG